MDNNESRFTVRPYAIALAALAAIFTYAMLIYAGQGWKEGLRWWLVSAPFGAWAISPYAGIAVFSWKPKESLRQALALVIGFALIVASGVIVLVDGFFIHSDAQNALLFVFLPFVQWIGILATEAISSSVGKRPPRQKNRHIP